MTCQRSLSPTGPYIRAICDDENGFLATTTEQWYSQLVRLVDDAALRRSAARAALHDTLWAFGPLRRAKLTREVVARIRGDVRTVARDFALDCYGSQDRGSIPLPDTGVLFENDRLGEAILTISLILTDQALLSEELLRSIERQTLEKLDLVIVGTASTAKSIETALQWVEKKGHRFNRVVVLRTTDHAARCAVWNTGIEATETPWALAINENTKLLPRYAAELLAAIRGTDAALVYLETQNLNPDVRSISDMLFDPEQAPSSANGINLVSLIAKEAWVAVGGYPDSIPGLEALGFGRRLVGFGFWGFAIS